MKLKKQMLTKKNNEEYAQMLKDIEQYIQRPNIEMCVYLCYAFK